VDDHDGMMRTAEEIADFLLHQNRPVAETTLIRFATDNRIIPHQRDDLFNIHFNLYHRLYDIRDRFGRLGYYTHTDPMRIRMISVPEGCSFYFPALGVFCGEPVLQGCRCEQHPSRNDLSFPSFDPMRDFYLNAENISFVSDPLFFKSLNGAAVYCFRYGAVKEALAFFGIAVSNPGRDLVIKRYRDLAGVYHPDRAGDESKMKQLNAHYDVLREAIPF
jgi:hypothetical protein